MTFEIQVTDFSKGTTKRYLTEDHASAFGRFEFYLWLYEDDPNVAVRLFTSMD